MKSVKGFYEVSIGPVLPVTVKVAARSAGNAARLAFRQLIQSGYCKRQPKVDAETRGWKGVSIKYIGALLLLFCIATPALAGQSPPTVAQPPVPLVAQPQAPAPQAYFVWPGIVIKAPQPYLQTRVGAFGVVRQRIIWR